MKNYIVLEIQHFLTHIIILNFVHRHHVVYGQKGGGSARLIFIEHTVNNSCP